MKVRNKLTSVLVLLALVVFPAAARAESSPGVTYVIKPPTLPQPHQVTPVEPKKPSEGSEQAKPAPSPKPTPKPNPNPNEEKEKKKPATAVGKGNGNGGTGNGQTGKSGDEGGKRVAATEIPPPAQKLSTGQSSPSGGGGSSPLVPIVLVIVVLAAISIGVVIYRQRKDVAV